MAIGSYSPQKRLFFALWPDDLTRQKCVVIQEKINNKTARWATPANLHVTLVFLGNVQEEQEFALRKEAARIAAPQLALCFDQLRYWKKPKVLCLTTTEIGAEIMQLVRDLTLIAEQLNIAVDKRAYQPHVTLARKVADSKVLGFESIHWVSSSFCLVESCPRVNQSGYRIIEEWDCKGS